MGISQLFVSGDAVTDIVALLLLLMSVASWVLIFWKGWLLRRAGADVHICASRRRGRMVQATACKAVYPGSIPGVASIFLMPPESTPGNMVKLYGAGNHPR